MSENYYEISIVFGADKETADAIFEELSDSNILCRGVGEGEAHVCGIDVAASMGPWDPDE